MLLRYFHVILLLLEGVLVNLLLGRPQGNHHREFLDLVGCLDLILLRSYLEEEVLIKVVLDGLLVAQIIHDDRDVIIEICFLHDVIDLLEKAARLIRLGSSRHQLGPRHHLLIPLYGRLLLLKLLQQRKLRGRIRGSPRAIRDASPWRGLQGRWFLNLLQLLPWASIGGGSLFLAQ